MRFLVADLPFRYASDIGQSVDACFIALTIVCGVVAFGVFAVIIYFCVRFRAGSKAPRSGGIRNQSVLEIGWTAVTLVIFVAIFWWAAVIYARMGTPPADAEEIFVVGKQWMWKVQHRDGRREINELHLLEGQPVKLILTSQDVIHDFYVPAFRSKQDALPGRYTIQWFTPIKTGSYHLFCAEYCGTDHSRMIGTVHVLDPPAYALWLGERSSEESLAKQGFNLFRQRGCSGCHSEHGTVRAPILEGIYNHPVPLADGRVVIAGDQYLHDSIVLPAAEIRAGYDNLMPSYQGQLSEEEIMCLIAYIRSSGEEKQ